MDKLHTRATGEFSLRCKCYNKIEFFFQSRLLVRNTLIHRYEWVFYLFIFRWDDGGNAIRLYQGMY